MHLNILFSSTLLCIANGAPQYGGVQPSPAAAPLRGQGKVKCVTQYATIWDTEYTETETEVVPQNMRRFAEQRPSACASQPQDRSAPQCMRNSVKQCTGMNVWSSSRL